LSNHYTTADVFNKNVDIFIGRSGQFNDNSILKDTVYIKWYSLHQMIQSTFNDKTTLRDAVYIKW